jgi:uncharacterized RDD family membrane protein YckC
MPETTATSGNARLLQPVDTRHHIETPEGIDLNLRAAGLVSRSLAFAIDLGIRGLILGVLFTVSGFLGKFGMGLAAILLFLVNWWYMVLFEVLNQGRSPGKQMMGLCVVQDDGTPIGWSSSLIRNLLRFVDMLPLGYFLGAVSCLQHPTFKRLGDLAAGTLVIYLDRPPQRPQLPQVEPMPAPFTLTLNEQRALMSLAERQAELSPQRVRELAAIIARPLNVTPAEAPERINRIARGLLGPT